MVSLKYVSSIVISVGNPVYEKTCDLIYINKLIQLFVGVQKMYIFNYTVLSTVNIRLLENILIGVFVLYFCVFCICVRMPPLIANFQHCELY